MIIIDNHHFYLKHNKMVNKQFSEDNFNCLLMMLSEQL